MAITTPAYFRVLGSDDALGQSEIAPSRSIGGGAVDESLALLDNATWVYAAHGRRILSEVTYYGADTPQAAIATETGTSYVVYLDLAADLGEGRQGMTVSLDIGYTGTGSGDVRVSVYRRDTGVLLGTPATGTTTLAQEQIDLGVTGVTVREVYVQIELKITTDGTVTLWGARLLEDAATLSVDGTLWRQIDQTAVAGLEPGDAYLYQRLDQNVRAADAERLRSAGTGYPADDLPVLSAHTQMAVPLAVWELTDDTTTLQLTVRHEVTEATVNLQALVVTRRGIRRSAVTAVAAAAGKKSTKLTVDVTGHGGEIVLVALAYQSEKGTAVGTTANISDLNLNSTFRGVTVHMPSAHGFTYTAGDRWVLELADPAASAIKFDGDGIPELRTIIKAPRAALPDTLYAWPPAFGEFVFLEGGSNFRLTVSEQGRTAISSWCLTETVVSPLLTQRESLRSGDRPAARAISTLYARERSLFRRRARVYHAGAVPDPEHIDNLGPRQICYWGVQREIATSWEAMGSALVGRLDDEVSRLDATDRIRDTYRVLAAVGVFWSGAVAEVDTQWRVRLLSFSGGSWSGTVVTSSTLAERLVTRGSRSDYVPSSLLTFRANEPTSEISNHYLRGSYPVTQMEQGTTGLTVIELEITDTETTADYRLLLLEAQSASTTAVDGRPLLPAHPRPRCMITCSTMTVLSSEGW